MSYTPSRPGEFHPEPLTEPCLTVSRHTARAPHEGCRLPSGPSSSSGCPLTLSGPDVGDLLPALHGHYAASLVLRSSPPLTGPSVLSASRFCRLCLFPCHRQPGSQVPYESPD